VLEAENEQRRMAIAWIWVTGSFFDVARPLAYFFSVQEFSEIAG
jgi:hypothetical protein